MKLEDKLLKLKKKELETISLILDKELVDEFRAVCDGLDVKYSAAISLLIRDFLDEIDKK